MSQATRLAIDWVEHGLVPDAVVRAGIRRLCEQRLREIAAGDCERAAAATEAFVAAMDAAELAPVPHLANERHYEVPARFFELALGPHLKYSSAWWPEGTRTLEEAEVRENAVHANQYDNQANPEAHYCTTGPEIWRQTRGRVDAFVAGMGTCGTISGTGRYLKEQNPNIRIVGVDPQGSILKEYIDQGTMGEPAPYKVEAIGEDIIPGALLKQYVDEVVRVTDRQSFVMVRRLARQEGILVGSSSGAAVAGALEAARRMPDDAVIVVLLPDTGERYLSKAHSEEWLKENRLLEG